MISNFEFYNPVHIIFGNDSINDVAINVLKYTKTKEILVVISNSVQKTKIWKNIEESLKNYKIDYKILCGIHSNPSLDCVYKGKEIIENSNIDFILAIGGASVIDTAKTLAVNAANTDSIWELIVNPKNITNAIPFGTVITLYGSGTEMTNGAVITNDEIPKKRGFDSLFMYPKFSVLDPKSLDTVERKYLLIGMMDMFSHVLEEYFEVSNNKYLCDDFLEILAKNMIEEFRKIENNTQDNSKLMWMSTMAQNKYLSVGMKVGGEWCAHIISHEFCLRYQLPHGIAVSILMMSWLKFIKSDAESRFLRFGKHVFGLDENATTYEVINKIENVYKMLECPMNFKFLNLDNDKIDEIARCSLQGKKIGKYKKITLDDVKSVILGGL